MGNHENFINKYHKNQIKILPSNDVMEEAFTSYKYSDSDYVNKIDTLCKISKPFIKSDHFIVTHAPCKNKYLGKIDSLSVKKQRKLGDHFIQQNVSDLESSLSFFKDEAANNMPMHICGHISLKNVFHINNKYIIDTGVYNGNFLACLSIDDRVRIAKEPAVNFNENNSLCDIFQGRYTPKDININLIDPFVMKKILRMAERKVNFISGTVSPSDADIDSMSIESIYKAFDYFKSKGVNKVILQPKYMGSRGNAYVFKDHSNCYMTSRNGYLIKKSITDDVFTQGRFDNLFSSLETEYGKAIKMILLDGELLPWRALGAGLIDEQYKTVQTGLSEELQFLKDNDFYNKLNNIRNAQEYQEFVSDSKTMDRKALSKKYKNMFETYNAALYVDFNDIDEQIEQFKVYKDQIDLFGAHEPTRYVPFNILKVVFEDGSEDLFGKRKSNIDNFTILSHISNRDVSDFCVVDLNSDESIKGGVEFFTHVTNNCNMEGIVMKPEFIYTLNVAPYMKVRSERYLHIIYGYDFKKEGKYKRLINTKKTWKKIKASIEEFNIGAEMLKIPYDAISKDNTDYLQVVANMIATEEKSAYLDPRL
jgi:hypothetical protein